MILQNYKWYHQGIVFAILIFLGNIGLDYYDGSYDTVSLQRRILSAAIGGLFFGLFMRVINPESKKSSEDLHS